MVRQRGAKKTANGAASTVTASVSGKPSMQKTTRQRFGVESSDDEEDKEEGDIQEMDHDEEELERMVLGVSGDFMDDLEKDESASDEPEEEIESDKELELEDESGAIENVDDADVGFHDKVIILLDTNDSLAFLSRRRRRRLEGRRHGFDYSITIGCRIGGERASLGRQR